MGFQQGKKQTKNHIEKRIKANTKHGHAKKGKVTKTYTAWVDMRYRCYNPNCKDYKNYGGRGISICERWNKFENFFIDMGKCPDDFMFDRIDNNGNYEPNNCRWINAKISSRNSRWVKLSMEKANEIRKLYSWGFKQCEIARHFNITNQNVNDIISEKRWK